jgi:hypothetical protein
MSHGTRRDLVSVETHATAVVYVRPKNQALKMGQAHRLSASWRENYRKSRLTDLDTDWPVLYRDHLHLGINDLNMQLSPQFTAKYLHLDPVDLKRLLANPAAKNWPRRAVVHGYFPFLRFFWRSASTA